MQSLPEMLHILHIAYVLMAEGDLPTVTWQAYLWALKVLRW